MDVIGIVEQHGYAVVAAGMFLTAAGVPMPASVLLLAAGAAADPDPAHHHAIHHGLRLSVLLPLAWLGAVAGDTLLYFGGRFTGWWLLAGMCRVSVDAENCIFRSSDYFYRRGPKTLLFAKFVPGLANLAAPLAGSLGMRPGRFLRWDAAGACGYVTTWLLVGYLFSPFIQDIVRWVERVGHVVLFGVLALVLVYVAMYVVSLVRARAYRKVRKVSALNLHERLQTVEPNRVVVIADVRSHGYYDPGMQRIKNSIRVEPHRLKEEILALREFMAPECEIYLYCSCIRDTTSARVAHMLEKENCRTTVIEGGLRAWVKAGGAVELVPETDMRKLPQFD
ncbi:MAG TPA: VTT domain-containing protein [Acidobacteriaceae bacterium]|nr:VTT domain-containing protein [Acidobacteriaceae bacterium]